MNKGRTIERESFRIIDEEMKRRFPPDQHSIVRRVIHATGDFEFEDIIRFHPDAVSAGLEAIRCGRKVLVDVKMVSAGINPKRLKKHSSGVLCFISDEDVIERSESGYGTRAEIAIEKAAALYGNEIGIVAIGNAPTALLKVMELKDKELFDPSLIVGVPVGFVSAVESKEVLSRKTYPFITCLGRKGGSTVAVAIVNALLLLADS